MRRISKKREELNKQAKPIRDRLIAKAGQCMLCGASPKKPNRKLPLECSTLAVHEISSGPLRHKSLDKPYACLVLCFPCNQMMQDKGRWPQARQLAVLLQNSPEDYDLEAFLRLTSPQAMQRITQREVTEWWKKMYR